MNLRFEDKHVQAVPEQSGTYCLWDHAHLVYVGRTAPRSNLRTELNHALTMAMAEDLSCTHFSYEVTAAPMTRAAEQLRDHFERWGALPRYNEARPATNEGAVLQAGRAA